MVGSTKNVAKNKVVEIEYTVHDADGTVLESTRGEPPMAYLHGAGELADGLEAALEGRAVGETINVTLSPDEAYGAYDEDAWEQVERSAFPEDAVLDVGMDVYYVEKGGESASGIIESADSESVTINYNHPYAGKTLTFDVQVMEVRDATEEELDHGHAHGPDVDDDEEWDDDDEWDEDDDDDDEWDETDDDDWEDEDDDWDDDGWEE